MFSIVEAAVSAAFWFGQGARRGERLYNVPPNESE